MCKTPPSADSNNENGKSHVPMLIKAPVLVLVLLILVVIKSLMQNEHSG